MASPFGFRGVRIYSILKQWADDAQALADSPDPITQAQLHALIGRFGKLCACLADLVRWTS